VFVASEVSGCHISLGASVTHVHCNTFKNRLERIEVILGPSSRMPPGAVVFDEGPDGVLHKQGEIVSRGGGQESFEPRRGTSTRVESAGE
jgi:hypothetical protein